MWGGSTHIPILKSKSSNKTPYTRRIIIKILKNWCELFVWVQTHLVDGIMGLGKMTTSLSTTLTIPHPQFMPAISMIRRSQRELVKMMMSHSPWQDQRQWIAYTPILEHIGPLNTFDLATRSTRISTITIVREPWQGSGDFWAQPAKIRPLTSTGFSPDLIGCKLVAINLDRPISYNFFSSAS